MAMHVDLQECLKHKLNVVHSQYALTVFALLHCQVTVRTRKPIRSPIEFSLLRQQGTP